MQSETTQEIQVALLTGGSDPSYVFGLGTSLMARGVALDIIGNNELAFPEFMDKPTVRFLNFRGDQRPHVLMANKVKRILKFYARLIRYAASARSKIFHILWNNKFILFDRTLLTLYYKLLGKKIVFTVHNVNTAKRDRTDSMVNRISLRVQYGFADHLFVHTDKMKAELVKDFGVCKDLVTVIPFGINNFVPDTGLKQQEARARLGIADKGRTILFYGRIKPYKGLDYLFRAFQQIVKSREDYRLIVAGEPHACEQYWTHLQEAMQGEIRRGRVLLKIAYIPDSETELYFKAADVAVLPYREIYQSGVLFLAYNFGLPVIATDVGSLKEDIVEGRTGFVCRPEDPSDLAKTIDRYFDSPLYADLGKRRQEIRELVGSRHSWDVISEMTTSVYARLLRSASCEPLLRSEARETSKSSVDVRFPS